MNQPLRRAGADSVPDEGAHSVSAHAVVPHLGADIAASNPTSASLLNYFPMVAGDFAARTHTLATHVATDSNWRFGVPPLQQRESTPMTHTPFTTPGRYENVLTSTPSAMSSHEPVGFESGIDDDLIACCEAAETTSIFNDTWKKHRMHFDLLLGEGTEADCELETGAITQLQLNRIQNIASMLKVVRHDIATAYEEYASAEARHNELLLKFKQMEEWCKGVGAFQGIGPFTNDVAEAIACACEHPDVAKTLLESMRAQYVASQKFAHYRKLMNDMRGVASTPACPICLGDICTQVLIPCGHCICSSCLSKAPSISKCFLCRQDVQHVNRIYLL